MVRKAIKAVLSFVALILTIGAIYTIFLWRPWIPRTPQTISVSFVLVHDSADVYTLTQLKINERDVIVGKTAVVLEGNTLTVDSLRKFFSRQ